jgi:hypothetical protein
MDSKNALIFLVWVANGVTTNLSKFSIPNNEFRV